MTTAATISIFKNSTTIARPTDAASPSDDSPMGRNSTLTKIVYSKNCFIDEAHLNRPISGPLCSSRRASSIIPNSIVAEPLSIGMRPVSTAAS